MNDLLQYCLKVTLVYVFIDVNKLLTVQKHCHFLWFVKEVENTVSVSSNSRF